MTTATSATSVQGPKVGRSLYLVALALLGPFFSPWIGIWTEAANVGSVPWRVGVYGQVAIALFYLFLALGVSALIAGMLGHRRVLITVAVASALWGLLVAIAGAPFVLDFFQLRKSMGPSAYATIRLAGFKVLAMAALGVPALLLLAFHALRAARALRGDPRLAKRQSASPLVGMRG